MPVPRIHAKNLEVIARNHGVEEVIIQETSEIRLLVMDRIQEKVLETISFVDSP